MRRDNLDYALESIVQSVKEGASFKKEASSASDHLKRSHESSKEFSSSVASSLHKLALDISFFGSDVSYNDIQDVLYSEETYGHIDSDNPLIKAANELRSKGLEEKQEKVAQVLNAAIGLSILREKIYGPF